MMAEDNRRFGGDGALRAGGSEPEAEMWKGGGTPRYDPNTTTFRQSPSIGPNANR